MMKPFIERQFDIRHRYIAGGADHGQFKLSDLLALHALLEVCDLSGVMVKDQELLGQLAPYLSCEYSSSDTAILSVVSSIYRIDRLNIAMADRLELCAIHVPTGQNVFGYAQAGLECRSLKLSPSLWDSSIYLVYPIERSEYITRKIIEPARLLYRDQHHDIFSLLEEIQVLKSKARASGANIEGNKTAVAADHAEVSKLKRDIALLQSALAVAHERLTKGSTGGSQHERV